ncbi:microsomal triacylglycerol transfer protein [Cylas formicarius]|uniref:microsomal triacylglycerol transfer protein n=1 Tax=Cylas formicarius TaxID=197179 RepID=UPI0029586A45|nr:microsomal triacylglycerol transfer protein [Cylas formicarius]XP_060522932.1 microsomal triacylglycerol transfer protein [Cylas formicarius]
MFPERHCNSVLCTLFFWVATLCSGFVLMSSAAGETGDIRKVFALGTALEYEWKSKISLSQRTGDENDVGFLFTGRLVVENVWEDDRIKILKLQLRSLKLHVKSRKAAPLDDFLPHPSVLDQHPDRPFFVTWSGGRVRNIYFTADEPTVLKNLKKGVAGLLQFQLDPGETVEEDASGRCATSYARISATKLSKTKSDCSDTDLDSFLHLDPTLGVKVVSRRVVEYSLEEPSFRLLAVNESESHKMAASANAVLGGTVESTQSLVLSKSSKCGTIEATDARNAIDKLGANEETLRTQTETETRENSGKFSKEVDRQRNHLRTEVLGTVTTANAFLRLLASAKEATKDDIVKTLSSKKNKHVLPQLVDILGHAHTEASHRATMKTLHLDREEQTDLVERYLWALSLSPHVNVDILEDLVDKFRKYSFIPEKIKKTLVLSIASMARTAKSSKNSFKVVKAVEETITNELDYAKEEDRHVYFAALKNLRSPSSVATLTRYIENGTSKEEYWAWKALRSFNKSSWNAEVLRLAEMAVFQVAKKRDSSSRTIAVDIILASAVSDEKLADLLSFVVSDDPDFEVKQYVFQSLKMLADKDDRVALLTKNNQLLHNYHGLAPRGLSTALRRNVFKGSSSEGHIVSVQEIKDGIVKRGNVQVLLETEHFANELFDLGIFSSGLGAFVSDGDGDEEAEDEPTTAGMELTVLGTQIRPFVFFAGQGELMGHVWSGSASEMTPAFQSTILVQDHSELVRLGSGFVAKLGFKGAASLDLSGKIEISLWSRNAQSLIEKSVGYLGKGTVEVVSPVARSSVEFSASVEPKLSLNIDADFSSKVKLCVRLAQPESVFSHAVVKTERVEGSKHRVRLGGKRVTRHPGKTYALNRKNNEMCGAIFS